MGNGLAYGDMAAQRPERTRTVSGKLVLLMLLVTACLVPFVTWATLRKVERDMAIDQPPLEWSERATWTSPPIKLVTLERSQTSYGYAPKGRWRPFEFSYGVPAIAALTAGLEEQLGAAETDQDRQAVRASLGGELNAEIERFETAVAECAALARLAAGSTEAEASVGAFTADGVRDRLQALAAEYPTFFYPPYLLGRWHDARGEHEAAEAQYEAAFALAPAVIKLRYVNAADEPMTDLPVGTVEVTCDRVIDDPATAADENNLDQTLKVVYPELVTDERGAVYLPCFHSVYRLTAWPEPPGYQVQHRIEGWFQFPGRIGAPKPSVVWRTE